MLLLLSQVERIFQRHVDKQTSFTKVCLIGKSKTDIVLVNPQSMLFLFYFQFCDNRYCMFAHSYIKLVVDKCWNTLVYRARGLEVIFVVDVVSSRTGSRARHILAYYLLTLSYT